MKDKIIWLLCIIPNWLIIILFSPALAIITTNKSIKRMNGILDEKDILKIKLNAINYDLNKILKTLDDDDPLREQIESILIINELKENMILVK